VNALPRQIRRRRAQLAVAGVAALSLVLAACGGDDGPATTEAPVITDAPVTTEAEMDADEMASDEMDRSTQFGPACGAVPDEGAGSFDGMAQDPAGTAASNNPLLTTLVSAVVEADLVDTLNSDGPFTIFAPVNDAFAAIPEDDLNAVLADTDLLTSILTYHVIAGENLNASALGSAGSAATVNGGQLTFGADGTTVNGVDVLCSDVTVANATVHIIGEVLMPVAPSDDEMGMVGTQFGPACSAVPEDGAGSFDGMAQDPAATAASNNPLLSTLVDAVVAADLVDTLNSDGPFTIFAPVNDAFAAIDEETLNTVLGDVDLLTSILTYHVIAGENLNAEALADIGTAATVNGGELTFGADGTTVNGVDVLCSDVTVANATVHIIGEVLLPES
jgi:uncharacterized surface protein with fasciclin (FAS1) repeats